jgi:small subunit ribosomal protein S17
MNSNAQTPSRKTTKIGTVIGAKMAKTVTVQVERQVRHPLYKKIVRSRRTFMAHDELGKCKVGDVVKIIETRPISRHKRWRVVEILGLVPQSVEADLGEAKS